MILDDLDIERIRNTIAKNNDEIARVTTKLKWENEKLQKIVNVVEEYNTVKTSATLEKTSTEGKKLFPLRTEQNFQRYSWLIKYSLLGFDFENVGNLTNFIDSRIPQHLELASAQKMEDFKNSGREGRIKRLLSKYLKTKENISADNPVTSSIETVP